jgi:leader peptidase (prepilin peptidase)/N-methyltransferase
MAVLLNVLLAVFLGYFAGKLMAMTVHFLPDILLDEGHQEREPRDIIKWFLQMNFPLNFNVIPYQAGLALLFGLSTLFFGINPAVIFVWIVSWILISCFITDYQHGILPDELTLSLVWVGLIASLYPVFITPAEAIIGAVVGYGIFWIFNVIYRYFRGHDGMYPGDFKLNAGIGACVGFKVFIPVLILSLFLLIGVTLVQYLFTKKTNGSNYLSREVPYACFVSVVILPVIYFKLAYF